MSKLINYFSFGLSIFGLTLFWTGANFWDYGYIQVICGQLSAMLFGVAIYRIGKEF